MTLKLQQAIRLLGLNVFEPTHFLEQELPQNPILDFSYIDGVRELFRLEDSGRINDTQGAIADIVGIHESAASRVVSNRYMLTPRGIFVLKFFFSPALPASDGGDKHSSE